MKKNQKGFSAIEVLVAVVIIGLLGVVGWLVYDRQKTAEKTSSDTNQTQQDTAKTEDQTESEFSLTTRLTSLNKKFALNVPDGWVFTNDTQQDYAYAMAMTYKKGEAAKINDELGHRGGGFTGTSFVIQYAKEGLKDYFSASKADGVLKLSNGKEAKKYAQVITGDELGIPDGSKSYGYQIDYEGGTIVFSYLVNPTDTDQRDLVEASIKTLSF